MPVLEGASLDRAALAASVLPLDGTLSLPGLDGPVTVHRDEWGIPHARAGSASDAHFALGFVHAQDRLFQMDLTRRRAVGRAAEWLGTPAAAADALARRLGVAQASQRDAAALGPEARAMLDAYARGVNAFLGTGAPLPIEYTLLGATPEPWLPWHSVAVMRRLGLLMGSVWFKLWRALALPVVGAEQVGKLRYDDGGADLLCIQPGETAERTAMDLDALRPAISSLLEAMGADETGGGSNNWAVAPARTATGRPILAGDPHRVFEMPGLYAQHHLACREWDAIGLTVPGVPGFPHFMHNDRVAYCVTHAFVDIHDLYLERFDEAGTAVRFGDGWEAVRTREETIAVRGGAPLTIRVTETRHGPVIAGEGGVRLALRSVQFDAIDRSFDCLPRMLTAGSVDELWQATRGWGVIDHNLVAADVDGHIGHRVRAIVARRPRANGWLPVPGWTGAGEWDGDIPFEEMPECNDPPGGVIVTANNRVVAAEEPYLCTDCHPPYRAQRIAALIAERPDFAVADAARLHADTLSPHRALFCGLLERLDVSGAAETLRQALLAWDWRMTADQTAPTAYNAWRRAMTLDLVERSGLGRAVRHPFAAVTPTISPAGQLWWTLPSLLRNDDTALLGGASWEQVGTAALEMVAGGAPFAPWGEAHRPRFEHALAASMPELAPLLDAPALPVGGDGDTVMAVGLLPAVGPAATYAALSRYVFDVGAWENCRWVVFAGASAHPGSPHYADQNRPWSACEMVPMRYDWAGIERAARATQVLRPG